MYQASLFCSFLRHSALFSRKFTDRLRSFGSKWALSHSSSCNAVFLGGYSKTRQIHPCFINRPSLSNIVSSLDSSNFLEILNNRQKDKRYVTASKMKFIFSLILLAASIIVDVPQASATKKCPILTSCTVEKPMCCRDEVPLKKLGCWGCCILN